MNDRTAGNLRDDSNIFCVVYRPINKSSKWAKIKPSEAFMMR